MKATLSNEALEQAVAASEQALSALRAEHEAIGDRILAEHDVLEALKDEQARRKLQLAQESGQALDWAYLLQEDLGKEHYKACSKALESMGLRAGGYFPETSQRAIEVALYKDKPGQLAGVATSLAMVMQVIKPLSDGWCYVRIFEHTLSAGGSFKLRFKPDLSEFQCVRFRYSREEVQHSAATLEALLPYIQKHHYYD